MARKQRFLEQTDGLHEARINGVSTPMSTTFNPLAAMKGELALLSREPRNRHERRGREKRLRDFLKAASSDGAKA